MADGVVSLQLAPESKRDLNELLRIWDKEQVYQGIAAFFDRESQVAAGAVSTSMRASNAPRRRTGTLARSVVGQGEILDQVPAMRIGILRGPALAYAGVQEFGTKSENPQSPYEDIVPRKAKSLSVPVEGGRAMTAAGVERFGGPTKYPGTLRFVPIYRGIAVGLLYDERDLLGALRKSEDGRSIDFHTIKAVYFLVRRVSIKPKHYLERGVIAYLPKVAERLGISLGRLLQFARGETGRSSAA